MLRFLPVLRVLCIGAVTACEARGPASDTARGAPTPPVASGDTAPAWSTTPDSMSATLRLLDGRTLTFRNDTSEQYDRPVRNRYVGTLPLLGHHVIEQVYYEGWNYLVVHPRTGRATTVWKPPVVSPSGRHLLVTSMDLSAGYVPTLVQVWAVDPDSLTQIWELETADYEAGEGWGASDPQWVSDTVARVMKHPFRGGRLTADSAPAWIVRTPTGWHVQDRAPDP